MSKKPFINIGEGDETVQESLKRLYMEHLVKLESTYDFNHYHSPKLEDGYFDAKPMILLLGQYSTGKSTFIRYLLGEKYPDIRIGEEPTTENFVAVMHGDSARTIPGNALASDSKTPFTPLQKYGNNFLSRFNAAVLPNKLLERVTFIDTPGILSGEKQRIDRGYSFTDVLEWFAQHVDVIVLVFDAHKLDISDEFKSVIEIVRKYKEKIRIVLNKADRFNAQKLIRVFGALMWSLGKVMGTPEVPRVYVGSFWDEQREVNENSRLFEQEEGDLLHELHALPIHAPLRKLNDFIRRATLAKVHALIISQLEKEMPMLFGKEEAKKRLINSLGDIYTKVRVTYDVPDGDFPDIRRMQALLLEKDFTKLSSYKEKLIKSVEENIKKVIPILINRVTIDIAKATASATNPSQEEKVAGVDVFSVGAFEGFNAGKGESDWIIGRQRQRYDAIFKQLNPDPNGKISIAVASTHMKQSRLSNFILKKIWYMADLDRDSMLDADEWALISYIIELKVAGYDLPTELPDHLIPPSKRNLISMAKLQYADDTASLASQQ